MIGSGLHRLRRIGTPAGWQVERAWHPLALAEFGVDMHAEVAAQRLAAQHGLAPPVLDFDPAAGVMRMPWVEGVALEPDWPRRASRRAAVRDVLERLRAVPAAALPPLDLAERVSLLHGRLAARDAQQASVHAPAVGAALAAWRAASADAPLVAGGSPVPCLVHGDLTPGNVLVREDGSLLLLDWEYAHAGGRWDDLAALCAAAEGEPFAAWVSDVPAAERDRFEAMRGLRRSLDALWYALAATLDGAPSARGPRTGIRPLPEAH